MKFPGRRRAQFSLEAMVLLAAYFAFVALLVSALSGQAREQALASKFDVHAVAARPVYAMYGIVASNATEACLALLNESCNAVGLGKEAVLGWR
ncbi:MAG: PucC family protein [Candidatus Micrarchaeota archaeon]